MKTQKVRVTKTFSFDMAHALYGYDGPCKNIHGHTYHLSVSILGKPIADVNDVKVGMVMDFGDLKKIVSSNIIKNFDHALVLNKQAPYSKSKTLNTEFEKVIFLPFQPTCENLLIYFIEILIDKFPKGIILISARLNETPSSHAEWFYLDNNEEQML